MRYPWSILVPLVVAFFLMPLVFGARTPVALTALAAIVLCIGYAGRAALQRMTRAR